LVSQYCQLQLKVVPYNHFYPLLELANIINTTERFTDLGKLSLVMVVQWLAPANFHNCPSYLKKDALFKKRSKLTQK